MKKAELKATIAQLRSENTEQRITLDAIRVTLGGGSVMLRVGFKGNDVTPTGVPQFMGHCRFDSPTMNVYPFKFEPATGGDE